MSAAKGYYSLIQYCPDRSRLEAANIGVLLFCPEMPFVEARLAKGNDRIRRFFGADSFDKRRVNAAKRAIEHRLAVDRESFQSPEDLVRFVETRGNDIVLTTPRPMRVSDPSADLDSLFEELVGGRARYERRPPEIARLEQVFRRPSMQRRVLFDPPVIVPVIGRELKVPYAYRNGQLNLVKPQRFPADKATTIAMHLAIEGDLLRRYPESGEKRQLIVVSAFAGTVAANGLRERVDKVLGEYEVRVVHEDEIQEFGKEVEREAH